MCVARGSARWAVRERGAASGEGLCAALSLWWKEEGREDRQRQARGAWVHFL